MRQAITILMMGLCVVLGPSARSEGPPPASEPPIIARAGRLIRAGDREAALALLEDALIDGPAGDRPAVLDLLRRSYEAMAREADAAGRPEVAAGYRDNLAILQRAHQAPRPSVEPMRPQAEPRRPQAEPARPRAVPAPAPARPTEPGRAEPSGTPAPESIVAPLAGVDPPSASPPPELRAPMPAPRLPEPVALPEPAKLPMPGPMPQPSPAAGAGALTGPDGSSGLAPLINPGEAAGPASDGTDGGAPQINPGEATGPAGAAVPAAVAAPARPLRIGADQAQAAAPLNGTGTTSRTSADPSDLATADQFFRAQNFEEAGRLYGAMATRNLLPADRRPHWAYCRFKAVVRRINAGPRSAREWDAIEAEVRSIQRLTPGNWYGEYLMNKVAEARRSRRRRPSASGNLVVRGSSPDDPAPPLSSPDQTQPPARRRPGVLGRSRGAPATAAPPAASPAASPTPTPVGDRPLNLPGSLSLPESEGSPAANPVPSAAAAEPSSPGEWQVHESPSFRIFHRDPAVAAQAAAVAESVRAAQARRWGSAATRAPWSPRCDLYLYPTARSFAEATGQPETSPGLSTMSNDGMRVLSRRMSLRADNPLLLTATLPHEVTHIVLADLFVAQAIPRWADEGLAVLAEPATELRHRQADLKGPLDDGRVFDAGQLMAMDYPAPKDWRLFYAQSVSLTRFLVEQGPPERFIQFVRDSQRMGTEAALRDVYQIDGVAALHERWLAYARKQAAIDVASSGKPEPGAADVRRD